MTMPGAAPTNRTKKPSACSILRTSPILETLHPRKFQSLDFYAVSNITSEDFQSSEDQTVKKLDRLICIIASFVPAVFVWLAIERMRRFVHLMSDYGGSPWYSWCTPITDIVFKTVAYWPYVMYGGWLLLIPAMFGRPWCRKLRTGLIVYFLLSGPVLYGLCLEGLYHSEMMVLEAWSQTREEIRDLLKVTRQRYGEGDSTVQKTKTMEDELVKKGLYPVDNGKPAHGGDPHLIGLAEGVRRTESGEFIRILMNDNQVSFQSGPTNVWGYFYNETNRDQTLIAVQAAIAVATNAGHGITFEDLRDMSPTAK